MGGEVPEEVLAGLATRLAEEFAQARPSRRPGRYAVISGVGALVVLGVLLIGMALLGLVI